MFDCRRLITGPRREHRALGGGRLGLETQWGRKLRGGGEASPSVVGMKEMVAYAFRMGWPTGLRHGNGPSTSSAVFSQQKTATAKRTSRCKTTATSSQINQHCDPNRWRTHQFITENSCDQNAVASQGQRKRYQFATAVSSPVPPCVAGPPARPRPGAPNVELEP